MTKYETVRDVIEALKRDVPALEASVEAARVELERAQHLLDDKRVTLATLTRLVPVAAAPAPAAAMKKAVPRRASAPRRLPKPHPKPTRRIPGALSAGRAAVQVLMEAGKPMHALKELLPRLHAMGVKTSKTTLPSALARVRVIEKTAPGTYTYFAPVPKPAPAEAPAPATSPVATPAATPGQAA